MSHHHSQVFQLLTQVGHNIICWLTTLAFTNFLASSFKIKVNEKGTLKKFDCKIAKHIHVQYYVL